MPENNLYNAAQIVGKTLFAKRQIGLKRSPFDSAPIIYNVSAGQPVGVVYSYLLPKEGRSNLYWVYKDSNGKEYYSEHLPGIYDINAITAQGGKDTLTIVKEQEAAAQSTRDLIFSNLQKLALLAVVAYLLKDPIKELLKK